LVGLHDDAPAGLVAATAVAGLAALGDGGGLDDGGDGGGDAGRHSEGVGSEVRLAGMSEQVSAVEYQEALTRRSLWGKVRLRVEEGRWFDGYAGGV